MNYTNISLPCFPVQGQYTTQTIMQQLSDAFLAQILMVSIILFGLQISCLWYIKDWQLPAWWKIDFSDRRQVKAKLFQSAIMISFVPAMYLPVIVILYKLGWFV